MRFLRRAIGHALVSFLVSATAARAQTFTAANSPDIAAHVSFSTGVTWVDFDQDGDLDLYVTTGFVANRNNVLYRNDGGTFVSVPAVPLVLDAADTACSAWADADNDGDYDVFVSNLATGNGTYYSGQGAGVYAVNALAGFPSTLKGTGCAWGDYDNDGFVDLVIAALFGQGGITTPNRLFHNDGDGTFTEVVSGPLGSTTDSHHHPTWSDFDGDGDLDLFFATGPIGSTDTDRMYRNMLVETASATFQPITTGAFATDTRDSQTLQWIDYDNDGDQDMFAVNYTSVPNQLYRNDGGGLFTKITTGAIVTDLGSSHGATWGDFDLDGDLDLYVATDLGQSNRYYRNESDGTFTRVTTGAFVTEARSNYGGASGDYDGDGDLDLFSPTARSEGASVLYRNDTANGNHWIVLRLQGTVSNRSAIGAKVRLLASIGGIPRWQLREVLAGTGYGGHNALEAHFGLGDAVEVDSVRIEWPSGIRQTIVGLTGDQRLDIVEDAPTPVLPGPDPVPATPRPGLTLEVRQAGNGPRARIEVPAGAAATLEMLDLQGRRAGGSAAWTLDPGRHDVALDPERSLPAGFYWLRVRQGAEIRAARAVFLR